MRKVIIFLFLTMYFSGWQGISLGRTQDPSQETQNISQSIIDYGRPSRFELSVEKTSYYVAEPVKVTMALFNDLEKPIAINGSDFSLQYGLVLYHRKVGRDFVRYYPRWLARYRSFCSISAPIEISPQEKAEYTERLFYNTSINHLVLPEPGEYEFKAVFGLKSGEEWLSFEDTVRIVVTMPPKEELSTLACIKDPILASFIEGDLQIDIVDYSEVEIGAEKAVAFLKRYPKSIYAPTVKDQFIKVTTDVVLTPKLNTLRQSVLSQ
jgi:hypothetical protein